LFTIVNSVLLEPLPVPEANRILVMANAYPKAGLGKAQFSGSGDYYDRLRDVKVFEEQALFNLTAQTIDDNGSPERIPGMNATPSLFRLLRVAPALGRTFTDSEGEIGANQKVILSHALWQRLYAGDPGVIGRELRLNGRPFTIVGVMPAGFLFVDPTVRYWIPLAFAPQQKEQRHSNNWYNVGRLKPGATVVQAQAQVNALNAANMERFPQWKEALTNAGFHTEVQPLQNLLVQDVQGTLYLLWGGAVFVLLIGAVNIANLALARATLRMKEFATRLALGASHSQIAWQLIAENALIALTGGLAGLALGIGTLKLLGRLGLDRFPRAAEVHVGTTVVLFSLAVAIVAGMAIAGVPLARIFRVNLSNALHESGRTGTGGKQSRFTRQALVVGQIAFAFVLLAGAGLLLASFRWLMNAGPGFRTEGVLTAATSAPAVRYPGVVELRSLMNRSLEAIRRLPGVTAAGATTGIPFSGNQSDGVILAESYAMKPGESVISPLQIIATPGYMEAIGLALVRGRYFDEHDNESSPRVIIVDERLARKFWPNRDPIGQRMFQPNSPDLVTPNAKTAWLKVVGVVRSARIGDITGAGNTAGAYYFPFAQSTQRSYTFAVRTVTDPSAAAVAVRGAIAGIDPALALFDVKTMAERKQLSLASERTSMSLALAFAALALFLSAVGIYSVLSYLLGQRRREIGIRLAVGSSPAGIFKLFIREGLLLIGGGLLLGFAGSIALRTTIANQIYGVQPLDPLVIGSVTVVLGGIALAACLRPAHEATKIDPVIVLNEQ
ncbi:MAG TPA: ABC transporter permease, partial [Bryobacteraceae bacterium]|nr:ABC transporter permease [Bryobacteraceae bacterium]